MHYKYIFVKLFLILLGTQSALAEISVTDNRGRVLDLAQSVVSLSRTSLKACLWRDRAAASRRRQL